MDATMLLAAVNMTMDELTNEELLSLNVYATLGGRNPEKRSFWKKAGHLFTSRDADGNPHLHEETKMAIMRIAAKRLGERN